MQQQRYCWKQCFLLSPCKGVIRKTNGATKFTSVREAVKNKLRWKGAAIQRGLEPRSRGTAAAGVITRQLLVKTLGRLEKT
jgi:hypothetical protein